MVLYKSRPLLQKYVVDERKPIKILVKAYLYSVSRCKDIEVLKFVNSLFFPCRDKVFFTASLNGTRIAAIVYHAGCD